MSIEYWMIAMMIIYAGAFASGCVASQGPRERKRIAGVARPLEKIDLEQLLGGNSEGNPINDMVIINKKIQDPFVLPDSIYHEASFA